MVPRIGFEPMTLGLEVLCSIQLSYQGTLEVIISLFTAFANRAEMSMFKAIIMFEAIAKRSIDKDMQQP